MDKDFQNKVGGWLIACLGHEVAIDTNERNHRFLEESLELVQATGGTKEEALMLVDYVFSRPKGEQYQEVGGVMVTLAALCYSAGLDLSDCATIEFTRIIQPEVMEKIRQKQATKPASSPLPGSFENPPVVNVNFHKNKHLAVLVASQYELEEVTDFLSIFNPRHFLCEHRGGFKLNGTLEVSMFEGIGKNIPDHDLITFDEFSRKIYEAGYGG